MREAKIRTTIYLPVDLYYAIKARIENVSEWVVKKAELEFDDNVAVIESKIHRLQDELAETQATYEHLKRNQSDRDTAINSALKIFKGNMHNDLFSPEVWARNQSQILREDYAVKISPAELLEIAEKRFIHPETEGQQEGAPATSQNAQETGKLTQAVEDSKEGV